MPEPSDEPQASMSQTERALRESEERYRHLLDHAPTAIVVYSEGRLVYVNPAAAALVGASGPEAVIGRPLRDLVHPDDWPVVAARMQETQPVREGPQAPARFVRLDGQIIHVEMAALPATFDGRPATQVAIHDITPWRKAMAALADSQRLLGRIADATPEIWYLYDAEAQQNIYANAGMAAVLGYSEEAVTAMQPDMHAKLMHPDDLAQFDERLRRLVASAEGEVVDSEYRVRHADGGWRWLWSRELVFARDERGAPRQTLGIAQDITDRKRAEEALRLLAEASIRLAASLDYDATLATVAHLPLPALADWCAVLEWDDDGAVQPAALAHVDAAREEELRRLARDPALNPLRFPRIGQALKQGSSLLVPVVDDAMLARAGEAEPALRALGLVSLLCVPLSARQRTVGALILVSADRYRRYSPADQRLAEELARRAALALDNARLYHNAQAAIHARDSFLSVAAHELKTPITSLIGYAQVLKRRASRERSLPERDLHALDVMVDQGARLGALIDDMLSLSRIRMGLFQLTPAPVDVCALVRRVASEMQPALDNHTLSSATPDEPLIVQGDARRLEQVVQNLVQNAVKYSPKGGPVAISVEQHGRHVAVAVADRGVGIPPGALAQIFQQFYRADNAHRQATGLGIGLYVVNEVVAVHGGSVDVQSAEGKGSTFTISLPLAED
jgi:PAS domain S-box-containing protein